MDNVKSNAFLDTKINYKIVYYFTQITYKIFKEVEIMYSNLGEKVKLLRKRRNLSLKQIEKLCAYFKVDISYFLFAETTDACVDLIEKAKLLFESKKLSKKQK